MNLHAGVPLESGGRYVIVAADTTDGRIGVEARKYRIANHVRLSREMAVRNTCESVLMSILIVDRYVMVILNNVSAISVKSTDIL